MDSIPQKRCKICGIEYPATKEYFHVNKKCRGGLNPRCKMCRSKDLKYHYWKDPEKARQAKHKSYWKNPEKAREAKREWRRNNPDAWDEWAAPQKERILDNKREWRKRNPDKVKKHKAASQKRNRASANERGKRWQVNHPEQTRAYVLNRLARKKNAMGKHTHKDIEAIYEAQEGRCFYCGITLHGDYHVDHVIPLSRGGTNWPDNLVCACVACNCSKNNMLLDEWQAVRGW